MQYPDWFEEIWSTKPKRSGTDSKNNCYKAIQARIKEGHTIEEMREGQIRYLRWCVNTGKIGTEFVMMGQTFFGPGCHFENPWELPKSDWMEEAFR